MNQKFYFKIPFKHFEKFENLSANKLKFIYPKNYN